MQTNAELQAQIAAMQEKHEQAIMGWLKRQESDIEKNVTKMLDARLEELVAKMMGFDYRYGRWELDHCNGRDGESAAGDWLRNRAKKAIEDWLEKQAGDLPALPSAAAKSLGSEYQRILLSQVHHHLETAVAETAREIAGKIASAIIGPDLNK